MIPVGPSAASCVFTLGVCFPFSRYLRRYGILNTSLYYQYILYVSIYPGMHDRAKLGPENVKSRNSKSGP